MKCPECGYETKKKSRKPISPEALEKATGNLWYVVCMLNKMPTLTTMYKSNSPEYNAFIESFVIHARILIEFLYGKPHHEDTIYASDYVDNWWDNYIKKGKPLEKTDTLREVEKKADKLAAHLTLTASEHEVYNWDRITICNEINKKLLGFLDSAKDNTRISEEAKSAIRNEIT